jgi:radical SAM superfamily enzyme YgiQ (UPF0313 family)
MSRIVLTTLNARYPHSAFGLRYLMANLGELAEDTTLLEFGINDQTIDILERIVAARPQIVGIGVYIWNVEPVTRLVAQLKRVLPGVVVILGGPEVSYEIEEQAVVELADYVITGEADLTFREVCAAILDGRPPLERIISAQLPTMSELRLPYELYSERDIAERVIYVEASRGCPFTCEFCLSALDIPVRQVPLEPFLDAMQSLLDRGVRSFKFVDRTFNLNPRVSRSILEFFLQRLEPGLFLHFEMVPDRLPEALRELIVQFPDGVLQFEVGIQTFNDDVCELISRKQDVTKLAENLTFLRQDSGVHIHSDLIVGLPGEDVESFGLGFDRLIALGPQEIQVGILKRLRGTPIIRHDDEWQMIYSPVAPYELLQNKLLDFDKMARLRRFARFWDLIGNSGNFVETLPLLWQERSPFEIFFRLSDWLFEREQRAHGIALIKLAERVFEFLTVELEIDEQVAAEALWRDYCRGGRHDRPHFLRRFKLESPNSAHSKSEHAPLPARQQRHQTR